MYYKASITFVVMFSRVFAIKVTFPHQSDILNCNQNATIQCDTESSTTTSMSWYLDDVTIADCISAFCSRYSQAPSHYVFTPGQSLFTLSLNPAKIEDSGKSIYCKDTTIATITADPKTINVEVEPTDSTTTLNYVVADTVSLNMTACLYPVGNLLIKWSSKQGDSITDLRQEQPTAGISCGSTDCMATSIVSEIELSKGSNTNALYSVCIEIYRSDELLLTKCTDQDITLEDLENNH